MSALLDERGLQREVIARGRDLGWAVAHVHDSRRQVRRRDGSVAVIGDEDAAGLPDLVMARPPRLIFAELKGAKGRLRPRQQAWLDLLVAMPPESGVAAYVWRPEDWTSGRIEELLR